MKDLWNLLHDGSVVAADGYVPGDLILTVEILYLREKFEGGGESFLLKLVGCTCFEYRLFEGEVIRDGEAIVAHQPEILTSQQQDEMVIVHCVEGSLSLRYETALLFLDNGQPVSLAALEQAAWFYWHKNLN